MLKLLGQGGMGQVYQARHLKLGRIVALKLAHSANHEPVQARFEEEVKAIASLRHPNIAQVYESGQIDGRPYFAMEYVAGGSLSDRLKPGPLPPRQAAELLLLLARAVQHAHEHKVLHRDLKPGNILLEEGSLQPKIADFGLAKRLNDDTKLTRTGEIFGSPSYMAPEQASGVMKLSPSIDVYALGAVLYECLTGRPPFMGPDAMQTLMLVMSDDPVRPKQLQPKLPVDLETICLKCLEKLPKRRYASAKLLAEDVDRFLKGEPILARPISSSERLHKWAVRKPWQATAVGLAVVLMIGLIVGLVLLNQAYRRTLEANTVADKSFELSKQTLDEVLNKVSVELSMIPNMEKVNLDSHRPAVKLFRELHQLRPQDRATTLEYANKLYEFTTLLGMSLRYEEAIAVLKETGDLLDEQLKQHPDDFDLLLAKAKWLRNRSWIARRQNQREQAIPLEKEALAILDSLKRSKTTDTRLMQFSNELLQTGIEDALIARNIEGVIERYRQVLANQEHIYELEPTPQHVAFLMSARKSLAIILLALNQLDEAEGLYQHIETSLPKLAMDERTRLSHQIQLAIARGDLARRRQSWKSSTDYLQVAASANRQLRQLFPEDKDYLYDEFDIRCKQAELLHDQDKGQEAIDKLRLYLKDADLVLTKHPDYSTISDHRTNYRNVLQRYEAELKAKQGK
ncbi:MAG TPA: serine/threonine-protein kinase [Gemmatales bacterium]|nr:serine/threonine-protein kinase [Gemmatales bacterium]